MLFFPLLANLYYTSSAAIGAFEFYTSMNYLMRSSVYTKKSASRIPAIIYFYELDQACTDLDCRRILRILFMSGLGFEFP